VLFQTSARCAIRNPTEGRSQRDHQNNEDHREVHSQRDVGHRRAHSDNPSAQRNHAAGATASLRTALPHRCMRRIMMQDCPGQSIPPYARANYENIPSTSS
jgi:hypothetical protein